MSEAAKQDLILARKHLDIAARVAGDVKAVAVAGALSNAHSEGYRKGVEDADKEVAKLLAAFNGDKCSASVSLTNARGAICSLTTKEGKD